MYEYSWITNDFQFIYRIILMSDFVHLHNHTDYSLLDAAQTVEDMCSRVYDLGMDSIAVTDHGNLFAMIPFYKQAQKSGIKPIIGCEIYVSVKDHTHKELITTSAGKKWGYHHLVLLAMNQMGCKNLIRDFSWGTETVLSTLHSFPSNFNVFLVF